MFAQYWPLYLVCLIVGAAPGIIYSIITDIKSRRKYSAEMKRNLAEFNAFLVEQDKKRGKF